MLQHLEHNKRISRGKKRRRYCNLEKMSLTKSTISERFGRPAPPISLPLVSIATCSSARGSPTSPFPSTRKPLVDKNTTPLHPYHEQNPSRQPDSAQKSKPACSHAYPTFDTLRPLTQRSSEPNQPTPHSPPWPRRNPTSTPPATGTPTRPTLNSPLQSHTSHTTHQNTTPKSSQREPLRTKPPSSSSSSQTRAVRTYVHTYTLSPFHSISATKSDTASEMG